MRDQKTRSLCCACDEISEGDKSPWLKSLKLSADVTIAEELGGCRAGRCKGSLEHAAERSIDYIKEFTAEVDDGKVTNYRINAKVTSDLERG